MPRVSGFQRLPLGSQASKHALRRMAQSHHRRIQQRAAVSAALFNHGGYSSRASLPSRWLRPAAAVARESRAEGHRSAPGLRPWAHPSGIRRVVVLSGKRLAPCHHPKARDKGRGFIATAPTRSCSRAAVSMARALREWNILWRWSWPKGEGARLAKRFNITVDRCPSGGGV